MITMSNILYIDERALRHHAEAHARLIREAQSIRGRALKFIAMRGLKMPGVDDRRAVFGGLEFVVSWSEPEWAEILENLSVSASGEKVFEVAWGEADGLDIKTFDRGNWQELVSQAVREASAELRAVRAERRKHEADRKRYGTSGSTGPDAHVAASIHQ
jgi:hypothetical protein